MENKDEVLDEMNDVSEISDIKPSVNLTSENDVSVDDKNSKVGSDTLVMEDVKTDNNDANEALELDLNIDNVPTEPVKTRSKAPIIIILSFLLLLDIVALVIYLIGVDKVIQFFM